MLAVRDEVDELKDKIVELQDDIMKINKENEALRGVLTPEQFAAVQPVLSRPVSQNEKKMYVSIYKEYGVCVLHVS